MERYTIICVDVKSSDDEPILVQNYGVMTLKQAKEKLEEIYQDEIYQDEAIVYLDAIPYMSVDAEDIDKSNLWTIHNSLTPNIGLYKVRASISGKGPAPRMRLYTRKQFNYQFLGLNWIYRDMNMR